MWHDERNVAPLRGYRPLGAGGKGEEWLPALFATAAQRLPARFIASAGRMQLARDQGLFERTRFRSVGERDGGSDQCYRRAAPNAPDAKVAP